MKSNLNIDEIYQLLDSFSMFTDEFQRTRNTLLEMDSKNDRYIDIPNHEMINKELSSHLVYITALLIDLGNVMRLLEEILDESHVNIEPKLHLNHKHGYIEFQQRAPFLKSVLNQIDKSENQVKHLSNNYEIIKIDNCMIEEHVSKVVTWSDRNNLIHQFKYYVEDKIYFSIYNGLYINNENTLVTKNNFAQYRNDILNNYKINNIEYFAENEKYNISIFGSQETINVVLNAIRTLEKDYMNLTDSQLLEKLCICSTVKIDEKKVHEFRHFTRKRDYSRQIQEYVQILQSGIGKEVL